MLAKPKEPRIPLPKSWQGYVKSAVLHAIALAHYAIVYAHACAADSTFGAKIGTSTFKPVGSKYSCGHAHLRTHRSPATVALAFALMSAVIGVGSTC